MFGFCFEFDFVPAEGCLQAADCRYGLAACWKYIKVAAPQEHQKRLGKLGGEAEGGAENEITRRILRKVLNSVVVSI
jgi:hypothetical protein